MRPFLLATLALSLASCAKDPPPLTCRAAISSLYAAGCAIGEIGVDIRPPEWHAVAFCHQKESQAREWGGLCPQAFGWWLTCLDGIRSEKECRKCNPILEQLELCRR